ncbi:MAG TPA: PEP-CTERM sorting domain-containing protein [Burkholderiales bacterium]
MNYFMVFSKHSVLDLTEENVVHKLLNLVAVGALLTVGPIQAFAAVDDFPLSDEIQIFNSGVPVVDFRFDDRGNSEHLLDPLIGTQPFPAWNGGEQALIFTYPNVTKRDISSSNFVLSLSESDGNISDTLWAQFQSIDGLTSVNIFLFDGSPPSNNSPPSLVSITNSNLGTISEDTFASKYGGNATSFLGLGDGSELNVLFASDPNFLAPVPEPEIYAMMGIGLALMGFVARRKRELQDCAAN